MRLLGAAGALLIAAAAPGLPLSIPASDTWTIESSANASGFGALGRSTVHAEVGDVYDVDRRGFAQFDLGGIAAAPIALLEFRRDSANSGSDFELSLDTYVGWPSFSRNIYSAPTTGPLATFFRDDVVDGESLSFDITPALNAALAAGDPLLGIRIRKSVEASQGLQTVTYVDFQLHVIPEPTTGALLVLGIAGLGARRRGPVAGRSYLQSGFCKARFGG